MPKGYLVAHITVHDMERYQYYAQASAQAQKLHGARVLARGGAYEALEGAARPRNVILEFDSYEQARRYYHSPEYQAARQHRLGAAEGEFVLIEGVD
jgi:uncharacterized protein (DUF1330 family)